MFEKCGGQKQSKKAGRPFKINFSLDIRIIQFIYLMYEVKTPQWETQTINLWKQDYINIISNNYYTLFLWRWDSEIRKNLSTLLFFFFFFVLPFLLDPFFSYPPPPFFSYRLFPSLIPPAGLPLTRSFLDIFPPIGLPPILSWNWTLGILVLFRTSNCPRYI